MPHTSSILQRSASKGAQLRATCLDHDSPLPNTSRSLTAIEHLGSGVAPALKAHVGVYSLISYTQNLNVEQILRTVLSEPGPQTSGSVRLSHEPPHCWRCQGLGSQKAVSHCSAF